MLSTAHFNGVCTGAWSGRRPLFARRRRRQDWN